MTSNLFVFPQQKPRCRSEQHALEYRLDRTWPRLSKFLLGTSGVGSCQEPGWVINMEKLKNRVFLCVFWKDS